MPVKSTLRTRRGKQRFIRELIRNVQASVLGRVGSMPETWDGIELRWLVAETFQRQTLNARDRIQRSRKRDYENEVLVRNL